MALMDKLILLEENGFVLSYRDVQCYEGKSHRTRNSKNQEVINLYEKWKTLDKQEKRDIIWKGHPVFTLLGRFPSLKDISYAQNSINEPQIRLIMKDILSSREKYSIKVDPYNWSTIQVRKGKRRWYTYKSLSLIIKELDQLHKHEHDVKEKQDQETLVKETKRNKISEKLGVNLEYVYSNGYSWNNVKIHLDNDNDNNLNLQFKVGINSCKEIFEILKKETLIQAMKNNG